MGVTSALKLRDVAENLENILALELFCAAQGVDFRRKVLGMDKKLGAGTRAIYEAIRAEVPFIEADTMMKPLMEKVLRMVRKF
jgi:histidine ammonia-lyase